MWRLRMAQLATLTLQLTATLDPGYSVTSPGSARRRKGASSRPPPRCGATQACDDVTSAANTAHNMAANSRTLCRTDAIYSTVNSMSYRSPKLPPPPRPPPPPPPHWPIFQRSLQVRPGLPKVWKIKPFRWWCEIFLGRMRFLSPTPWRLFVRSCRRTASEHWRVSDESTMSSSSSPLFQVTRKATKAHWTGHHKTAKRKL